MNPRHKSRVRRALKHMPYGIALAVFLTYALCVDSIIARHGMEGFGAASILMVSLILACWCWDSAA